MNWKSKQHFGKSKQHLGKSKQCVGKVSNATENLALQQIDDRMYAKEYEDDYDQILCYGMAFFKKRCMVKKKEV